MRSVSAIVGARLGAQWVVVLLALVVASCATSIDVSVNAGPEPTSVAADQTSPIPSPAVDPPANPTPGAASPTAPATETPTAEPPAPTPARGLDYEEAITLYFDEVERFWTEADAELGFEFVPVARRVPYDPEDSQSIPACDGETGPFEVYVGNAFYCEADDYIAWDDVDLFPGLDRLYGGFTVGLVIAHEYAHAVQSRARLSGPTIFVELQADCLAGAWAASVANQENPRVPFDSTDLDDAIGGFLTFADPLGTPAIDPAAHGTAFDRLHAFSEGFQSGVGICDAFLTDPPLTTSILVDPTDANEGNLPLDSLLPLLLEDLNTYVDAVGEELVSPGFDAPSGLEEFGSGRGDPADCGGASVAADSLDGSAFYCSVDGVVYADRGELEELWSEVGDFGPAYVVAHAYATSVTEQLDSTPEVKVVRADCLVGVWTRDIFDEVITQPLEPDHVLFLSAGDLDEGIVGLLLVPPVGPSLVPIGRISVFERVDAFGDGFFRGPTECGFG